MQTKFKEQAGKDKQLLHDLDCTALIKANEAQKLESKLEEIFSKMHDLQVDYLDKMACDDECKRKRELDTFREQWFKLWSNDIDIVASKLTQANRTIEAANKMTDYSIAEILQKWELGLIPKDSRVILLIPRKESQEPIT
jgi:hypothetical protein